MILIYDSGSEEWEFETLRDNTNAGSIAGISFLYSQVGILPTEGYSLVMKLQLNIQKPILVWFRLFWFPI